MSFIQLNQFFAFSSFFSFNFVPCYLYLLISIDVTVLSFKLSFLFFYFTNFTPLHLKTAASRFANPKKAIRVTESPRQ